MDAPRTYSVLFFPRQVSRIKNALPCRLHTAVYCTRLKPRRMKRISTTCFLVSSILGLYAYITPSGMFYLQHT